MNTKVQAIYKETVHRLEELYGESEAHSLANILFEDLHGISKLKRLSDPRLELPAERSALHQAAILRLLDHEPIQQIMGFTYFYGHRFLVTRHTLIPRPETEELVDLIRRENPQPGLQVLDIGTGSGCIAISLALGLRDATVTAWDVSSEALAVAAQNADELDATVTFAPVDVLKFSGGGSFDIIVSNPPYIPHLEKGRMSPNVVRYEPEAALFVPDDDPLLFYRKIGELGRTHLRPGGKLYFEIHERYGRQVQSLLEGLGYLAVEVVQDLQEKDRIVKSNRPS